MLNLFKKKTKEETLRAKRDLEKRWKKDKERARAARLRYAKKRAQELGVSVDRFVEEKDKRKKEQRVARKKEALKLARRHEKQKLLKIQDAKKHGPKVEWETVSVVIPYSKRNIETVNTGHEKALIALEKLCKDKKLGYYDGNEYGIGDIDHFKWFFSVNDGVGVKRVGKLMSTILKKYTWSKGVIVDMNSMLTDATFSYTRIKL